MSDTNHANALAGRELVEAFERRVAEHVARVVVPLAKLSVWEILIPILIALGHSARADKRKAVAENLLRVKILALDGAQAVAEGSKTRAAVLGEYEAATAERLAKEEDLPTEERFYSAEIRTVQLAEVALLLDHYVELFLAEGNSHAERVRAVCPRQEDYTAVLDHLAEREAELLLASSRVLGERGDPTLAATMGEAADAFRRAEARKIYADG